MKNIKITATIICLIMISLTSCSTQNQNEDITEQSIDKVDVRLKWLHQAQFAGFYVAEQKGYYKDNNLEVSLNPGGVDFPSIQIVSGGGGKKEQFGIAGSDQILLAREKGIPLVALAAIYKKTPIVFMSLKELNISTPHDFSGKNIGIKPGRDSEIQYRAMMKKLGLTTDDTNEIPVQVDLSSFFERKIDVWPAYVINEAIIAKDNGFDINVISPHDYGIQFYGDTLFTTENMIKNNPDLVKRFVQATIKGWIEAYDDPDSAAGYTVMYSDYLELGHEKKMMMASLELLKPDDTQIGVMDKEVWVHMQDVLLEQGIMEEQIDIDTVFTNEFI